MKATTIGEMALDRELRAIQGMVQRVVGELGQLVTQRGLGPGDHYAAQGWVQDLERADTRIVNLLRKDEAGSRPAPPAAERSYLGGLVDELSEVRSEAQRLRDLLTEEPETDDRMDAAVEGILDKLQDLIREIGDRADPPEYYLLRQQAVDEHHTAEYAPTWVAILGPVAAYACRAAADRLWTAGIRTKHDYRVVHRDMLGAQGLERYQADTQVLREAQRRADQISTLRVALAQQEILVQGEAQRIEHLNRELPQAIAAHHEHSQAVAAARADLARALAAYGIEMPEGGDARPPAL